MQIQSKLNELRENKSLLEKDWTEHWDILNISKFNVRMAQCLSIGVTFV